MGKDSLIKRRASPTSLRSPSLRLPISRTDYVERHSWIYLKPCLDYLVNAAGTPPSMVNIHPVVFSDTEDAKNAIPSAISRG